MTQKKILIVMGSDSDFPVMEGCFRILREFEIAFDARICSAHRSPDAAKALVSSARKDGYGAIIAAAGLAAHLPGVLASFTTLPVIGVPCKGGALAGVDALYSIVQMPTGIPVATVAIDGGTNAGILAAEIFSVFDERIAARLSDYKKELEASVAAKDIRLQEKIDDLSERPEKGGRKDKRV